MYSKNLITYRNRKLSLAPFFREVKNLLSLVNHSEQTIIPNFQTSLTLLMLLPHLPYTTSTQDPLCSTIIKLRVEVLLIFRKNSALTRVFFPGLGPLKDLLFDPSPGESWFRSGRLSRPSRTESRVGRGNCSPFARVNFPRR